MTTIKTMIVIMIITIATKITKQQKYQQIKSIFKNKRTPLISDISENLCPQNAPVLLKYKW